MRSLAVFLIGFFPYCFGLVYLLLVCMDTYSNAAAEVVYPFVMVLPVVTYVLARRGRTYLLKNADRADLVRSNLLLNAVQVPAHLLNTYICVGLVLTLFGIIMAPYVIAVIILSFKLTGQLGREAVQWALEKGLLTQEDADRENKRQSVPVMSLISAITLYRRSKEITL